ncbi:hypothetical protein AMTRI_Chr03g141920 [Amborella trichopoda]|uniref:gibberellin 2beta-dioxygenase n=1 Tax=Amborella trichopoda TaxID=13333 RepID=W1P3D4_AMBTC|nr:gibberellin 2-beta-dioxygenase [Amborella trichopoda]ERN02423.1 hypothetical protein AMTR_s00096p00146720 [Amborella trichopoda]|eukprot:XP_006840748.1 gibberellin 2-beta-dioxygenase [Amborella trichopoda]
MVVLSIPVLDPLPIIKTHKAISKTSSYTDIIPVIDLLDPRCGNHLVRACEEFGFFKVVNHGVSFDIISRIEGVAAKFFSLPLSDKERAGPANPYGYGNRRIGPNGDVGWLEYLLSQTDPGSISQISKSISRDNPNFFCVAVNDYVSAVRKLACELLDLLAKEMGIEPRNAFSGFLRDEKSEKESVFRMNHYPPCPELQSSSYNLIGFGEHSDPQIFSVLRSNSTSGLQICLKDGIWVAVPSDPHSFYINVGDSLEVLTNGKFRSVRHRVVANSQKSRVSMVYFGSPSLSARVAPLACLLKEGEKRKYKGFTWSEYKKAAYASRLADNRLDLFKADNNEERE